MDCKDPSAKEKSKGNIAKTLVPKRNQRGMLQRPSRMLGSLQVRTCAKVLLDNLSYTLRAQARGA